MNILLVEPEELTRDVLEQLLATAFPGFSVAAAANLEAGLTSAQYSAVVLGLNSIQGLEGALEQIAGETTLVVQASTRLGEPGAGVTVSSLRKPEHLIAEIDRSLACWPTRLVQRLRSHFASPEIERQFSGLHQQDGHRVGLPGATTLIRGLVRARNDHGEDTPLGKLIHSIPPVHVHSAAEQAQPIPSIHGSCEVRVARLGQRGPISKEHLALANLYSSRLSAAFHSLVSLGRQPPRKRIRACFLGADEMLPVFREAFSYDQDGPWLILPITRLHFRALDLAKPLEEIEFDVFREITRIFNHADGRLRSAEWDWFDEAIANWFAIRNLEAARELPAFEDRFNHKGLSAPFDALDNLRETVRFVQFLEGGLGARRVFELWQSRESTPQRALARERVIDPYFDWLQEAHWDDLVQTATRAPWRSAIDHCSCHIWLIPLQFSRVMFSTPKPNFVKAAVLRRFVSSQVKLALPAGQEVLLPAREQGEERLLMVRNVGHRHRNKLGVHDDGIDYQLDMAGK